MPSNQQSVHHAMYCAQIVGVTIATAFLALAMLILLTAYEASVEASKLAAAAKSEFSIRRARHWNNSESGNLVIDPKPDGGHLSESSVKRRSCSEQAKTSSPLASTQLHDGTIVV